MSDDGFQPPIDDASRPGLPQPRFSLKWLLIAVTVFAFLLGASVLIGNVILWTIWSVVHWALPVPLVVGAVFGRGDVRAFSVGALVPWLSNWMNNSVPYALVQARGLTTLSVLFEPILAVLMSAVCGWLGVKSYRWLVRHGLVEDQG